MSYKKVLITGANSGIGLVTATQMASMGYYVIMVCRDQQRGLEALDKVKADSGSELVELMLCDVGSLGSIKTFYEAFAKKHDALHILINNAGVAFPNRRETAEGFELHFAVNYLGPFALTAYLLPHLKLGAPARIINVSSMAYTSGHLDFEDLQMKKHFKSMNAYAQSKLAVVLWTRRLSQMLSSSDITVNCLHPGLTGTQMGVDREKGTGKVMATLVKWLFQSPDKGARTTIYLATSSDVIGISGQYFEKSRLKPLHKKALDDAIVEKLWQETLSITGIEPIAP